MTEVRAGEGALKRTIWHALGNVFLGIAVGLLGYYLVTDLFTATRQRALFDELPAAIAADAPPGVPVVPDDPLDFAGWEEQDRAYWRQLDEGEAFGRLVAPAMKLDSVVVKGTGRADLRRGPGWITWSDLPGPTGNCGISGHRTTYGAPFRRLDQLSKGDEVRFYSPYRIYTYRVKRVFAVTPDRVEVVASTDVPTLTLTACHPPYSARLRLIAQSELVSVQLIER